MLKKNSLSVGEIKDSLKVNFSELEKLLIKLGKNYPGIARIGERVFIDDPRSCASSPFSLNVPLGASGKFAAISCSHLGSKYMQLTQLYEFYSLLEHEKVDCVFHCGDFTDGDGKVYRGQRYEMFLQGFSEQRDYAVEMFPRLPSGAPTYFIAGNHDDSFSKSAGVDICFEIAKERSDLIYLGRYAADAFLNEGAIKIRLHHGGGGRTYAISYKMQKYFEALAPDDKPTVYLLGHFHRSYQLFLRNIHGFEVGCFQAQTPLALRFAMPWQPAPGGWIIEYEASNGWALDGVKSTFIPFYVSIKEDWKNYPH